MESSLEAGKQADFLILNEDLKVRQISSRAKRYRQNDYNSFLFGNQDDSNPHR